MITHKSEWSPTVEDVRSDVLIVYYTPPTVDEDMVFVRLRGKFPNPAFETPELRQSGAPLPSHAGLWAWVDNGRSYFDHERSVEIWDGSWQPLTDDEIHCITHRWPR